MAIPLLVGHTCVSTEKTLLISSWNTGLAESIQPARGQGEGSTVTWDNLPQFSFQPHWLPCGAQWLDAYRDNVTALQQVNRADGSQRVVSPQEPPRMLFILGLHCGCYMVLILYFPRVFIPNSPFFQVPKPQGLSATTGQHRNRDKPIIFRWKESTVQTGEGREWYRESDQSHFFPLQNLLPPNFQDLHRSKCISTSCLSSRPMLLLAWLS